MGPEALFQVANSMALLGWIALALGPLAPRAMGLVGGARPSRRSCPGALR